MEDLAVKLKVLVVMLICVFDFAVEESDEADELDDEDDTDEADELGNVVPEVTVASTLELSDCVGGDAVLELVFLSKKS